MIDLDIKLTQGSFHLAAAVHIDGRAAALFGPSGAGKTTILDAIAGLRAPRRGSIVVNERVLFSSDAGVNLPPHHRHVGYVPQDVALFPHMRVRGNLLYGRHPGVSPDLDRVVGMLLAAVDVPLRRRILPYLRRVRDELTVPIIYVSHDREEVEELADVVVKVEGGRVVGVDRVGGIEDCRLQIDD